MLEEFFERFFQVTVPLKRSKTRSDAAQLDIAKYLKFDVKNSHLLLDISLPTFLPKITFVAINHYSTDAISNLIFPVMDKVI